MELFESNDVNYVLGWGDHSAFVPVAFLQCRSPSTLIHRTRVVRRADETGLGSCNRSRPRRGVESKIRAHAHTVDKQFSL